MSQFEITVEVAVNCECSPNCPGSLHKRTVRLPHPADPTQSFADYVDAAIKRAAADVVERVDAEYGPSAARRHLDEASRG